MESIKNQQEKFFEALAQIQKQSVEINLLKSEKGIDIKDILTDVSYDVIYNIMELIDGYYDSNVNVDLIVKDTGISIRKDIELHDRCVDYIKASKY